MGPKSELVFQYIYQQPQPFEKFVFNSLLKKRSTLQSEIVLCSESRQQIYIICDLYSQIDPPLLSPHVLTHNDRKNSVFIVDCMQQVDSNLSYFKYNLNNCHIWRKCNAKRGELLWKKLSDLKSWQIGRDLSLEEKERIENIVKNDYFNVECEKKVYLGFTAYIHDNSSNTKKPLAPTIYSHAIYDSSDVLTMVPNHCSITGGSEHKLKFNGCWTHKTIHIKLSDKDNSWHVLTTGILEHDCFRFHLPPYSGRWSFEDGNRLIDVDVLDTIEGFPKGCIKVVYI